MVTLDSRPVIIDKVKEAWSDEGLTVASKIPEGAARYQR